MHLFVRIALGILEVIGGILGVAIIVADAWTARAVDPLSMLVGGFYAATILAGVALLRCHRLGGILSLFVQLLQVPRIAAAGCAGYVTAGAAFWVMFGTGGVGVSHMLGSAHQWNTLAAAEPMPFGVNLVAALAIALLLVVPVPKTHRQKQDKRKHRPLAFA